MDKQRILKEAQIIAAKYSFWMVSGEISHLYGYVYEIPGKKYDLEIRFDDSFPNTPPQIHFHNNIKELLGYYTLKTIKNWNPEKEVIEILDELNNKIFQSLGEPIIIEEKQVNNVEDSFNTGLSEDEIPQSNSNEYLTPNYDTYPIDFNDISIQKKSNSNFELFNSEQKYLDLGNQNQSNEIDHSNSKELNIAVSTELGLIQQYYTYDQKSSNPYDINVYITITISKTFIIGINLKNYPEKPIITFPDEVLNILGFPDNAIKVLKKWNPKKPSHIIDILQELEKNLFFIKDIESEYKKISNEFKTELISNKISQIKIHLLTYGFKEYQLNIDLNSFPNAPLINLTKELQELINIPISNLKSYKNWKAKESESVEIVREIAWLVDKTSRIKFEIDLLKSNFKNIKYDPASYRIEMDMKGKMRTEDLIFKFEVLLPDEYPMKIPRINVLNEFELDSQIKIKEDLQSSFNDFFKQWTPFSYLVDLFNLISKKIFEISAVSCVICHSIDCPACSLKIAGSEQTCYAECPHCERAYHKHCYEQTLNSFGKCGFCLKPLPHVS